MINSFELPFLRKEQLNSTIWSFYFARDHLPNWNFLPGQYIRMILPHESPDERGTMRYFTISSSPLEKEYITITTKIIKSSFKKSLLSLKPNQKVRFLGPFESFNFNEEETNLRVFFGGGIGITPYISLIRYWHERKLSFPIILFVSWKTPEEMIFHKELEEIVKENKLFTYIPLITQVHQLKKNWNGEKGRITKEKIEQLVLNRKNTIYYVVGALEMVDNLRSILKDLKINEDQIRGETFNGY